MNKVILMGRLTRDPEVRYTQGNEPMAIARYTLAVDRRGRKDGGEATADFIQCVAFRNNAEFAEKYLRQGTKIAILMDGTINKGVILSIEGNTAKVAPMKDTRLVSPNIQIADNIDAATLKKGAAVAYVCFEDDTGLIFATLS